jgi:hypothetical protein
VLSLSSYCSNFQIVKNTPPCQDKIDNILAKNTDENGLYPEFMRRLKPDDCKVGDIVRDVCGQFSEIKEVKHNANEYG